MPQDVHHQWWPLSAADSARQSGDSGRIQTEFNATHLSYEDSGSHAIVEQMTAKPFMAGIDEG